MIEISYHPEVVETVPSDYELVDGQGPVPTSYREEIVQNERYDVCTYTMQSSKSWNYTIEQNDNDEWVVTSRSRYWGKYSQRVALDPRSTPAVREAMREKHDIELAN